jgi:hypothetical protein
MRLAGFPVTGLITVVARVRSVARQILIAAGLLTLLVATLPAAAHLPTALFAVTLRLLMHVAAAPSIVIGLALLRLPILIVLIAHRPFSLGKGPLIPSEPVRATAFPRPRFPR